MGRSSLLILGGWCSCLLAVGCTLPLDATDAGTDAPIAPDAIEGCALFAGAAPSLGVGHSLDLPNGATLWTFDGALVDGGRSDGIAGRVQIQTDGCPGALVDAQIALPPSATDTDFAVPLDLVRVGADVWQFYETWRFAAGAPEQPFGHHPGGQDAVLAGGGSLMRAPTSAAFGLPLSTPTPSIECRFRDTTTRDWSASRVRAAPRDAEWAASVGCLAWPDRLARGRVSL